MAEQGAIGNDEPWNRELRHIIAIPSTYHRRINFITPKDENDDFSPPHYLSRPFQGFERPPMGLVAGALAASAAPGIAAAQAARPGAFDGTWNVTFAPKAGNCHATNTVPFNVYGTRVSSAGGGKVTGGVTRRATSPSGSPSAPLGRTAAAGSPAIRAPAAGAGSLPATTAAGSGRRPGVRDRQQKAARQMI